MSVRLSLVLRCENEQQVAPEKLADLFQCVEGLEQSCEFIFVDDGSSDGTCAILKELHARDSRCKMIRLTRRFGRPTAILAGLNHTSGEIIGIVDAGVRETCGMLQRCLEKLQDGYDIAYGLQPKGHENWVRHTAYRLYSRMAASGPDHTAPLNADGLCLLKRNVAELLLSTPEHRFSQRRTELWQAFRQIVLEYEHAGEGREKSVYSAPAMAPKAFMRLSVVVLSLTVLLVAALTAARFLHLSFFGLEPSRFPTWPLLLAAVLLVAVAQTYDIACMARGLTRMQLELKGRPRWAVQESAGFSRNPIEQPDPDAFGAKGLQKSCA